MSVRLACLECGQGNRVPEAHLDAQPICGTCGGPLMSDTPTDISLDVLTKAERLNDILLILDFWAACCGPCRMMAPEFDKAAKLLKGRARFAKLDTESFLAAGARYGIQGIPLLVAFHGGREIGRRAGVISAGEIASWIGAGAQS